MPRALIAPAAGEARLSLRTSVILGSRPCTNGSHSDEEERPTLTRARMSKGMATTACGRMRRRGFFSPQS